MSSNPFPVPSTVTYAEPLVSITLDPYDTRSIAPLEPVTKLSKVSVVVTGSGGFDPVSVSTAAYSFNPVFVANVFPVEVVLAMATLYVNVYGGCVAIGSGRGRTIFSVSVPAYAALSPLVAGCVEATMTATVVEMPRELSVAVRCPDAFATPVVNVDPLIEPMLDESSVNVTLPGVTDPPPLVSVTEST
jgi:hypothetical protein